MSERKKLGALSALFAAVLLLGVMMVLTSGADNKVESGEVEKDFSLEEYEAALEKRLTEMIEKIDGVGSVSVMITMSSSAVYTFLQDTSIDLGSDGERKTRETVVMSSGTSGVKEAVVSGYTLPEVKGAAVVCTNRVNADTVKSIIGIVSASLGIPSNRIYVTN